MNHKNAKCARHWSAILQEGNIIQNSKPSSNWRIIFCDWMLFIETIFVN